MKTGKALEKLIETAALNYEHKGWLRLRKADPPTFTKTEGGKKVTYLLPNPFPDFIGSWSESYGRALFIEAKSTMEPRLSIGHGITYQQLADLRAWSKTGAVTGIVWEYCSRWGFVGLWHIDQATGAGRKSVAWEDCIPIESGEGVVVNFIAPIRLCFGSALPRK